MFNLVRFEMGIDERGSFLDHAAAFQNHVDSPQTLTPSPNKAVHIDPSANTLSRVRNEAVQKRVDADLRALEESFRSVSLARSLPREVEESKVGDENEYERALKKLQMEKRQREEREKKTRDAEEHEIEQRIREAAEVAQKAREFAQAALEAEKKEREGRERQERREKEEQMRRHLIEQERRKREESDRIKREAEAAAAKEQCAYMNIIKIPLLSTWS